MNNLATLTYSLVDSTGGKRVPVLHHDFVQSSVFESSIFFSQKKKKGDLVQHMKLRDASEMHSCMVLISKSKCG